MNTTHIYEPDEQDTQHFQIATWYGPHDKLPTDIPVPDRVQVWGDPYMLSITAPGGDSIMLMKESIDGLKLMLDWYEDWLEENDHD